LPNKPQHQPPDPLRVEFDPRLEYLIALPEMPTNQIYEGATEKFTFTFGNGKTFTVHRDSDNLIWIDPEEGPTKLSANLTSALLERIEATRDSAQATKFLTGAEFLTSRLKTSVGPSRGVTTPASRSIPMFSHNNSSHQVIDVRRRSTCHLSKLYA